MHKHTLRNSYLAIGFFLGLVALGGWYLVSRSSSSYAAVATIDKQVAASADDAYHTQAGWPNYSHTDGVVYAGAPGGNGPAVGGWRWTGLNIPAGATITNAYVELNQTGYGNAVTTTLALEKTASPATFSAASSPATRWGNKTTFQTSFVWASKTPNSWIKTPSLVSGIQELVNTYGAIDSVVLLENGIGVTTGQYHAWTSYDGNAVFAAKLHIEYNTDGVAPTSSPSPTPSVAPSSGNWPEKVDLATNESRTITLRDGTTRTLTLQSYSIVIPRYKIQTTVSVSGAGKTETHTLEVGFGADAVSINGLRLYAYTWKEADDVGSVQGCPTAFEAVSIQGCFPLTSGKDIGFAVSDARYTMYPSIDQYTYPVDLAFHEGTFLQTFLDPDDWAHSGYDIGTPFGTDLLAVKDGYLWISGATAWITESASQADKYDASKPCWLFTHSGTKFVGEGFIRKGTRIADATAAGNNSPTNDPNAAVDHYHMGSCNSFDFGSWYFTTQIWNYEHQNNFPSPRYWLVLGPFSGDINTNNITIPANPKEGDTFNSKSWKFADNLVNSVTRIGDLLSDVPFSGHSTRDAINSTGYAAAYIYSPAQMQATLKFGAGRGAKIWLNGQLLDTITGTRYDSFNPLAQSPIEIDRYPYSVTLNTGWNTLIVKTDLGSKLARQTVVPMLFSVKIGDANGNKIPSLTFSTRDINLQTTSVGNTSLGLSWSHPNYHGTFVSSYKVDVATDAAFSNIVKTDTVSNTSTSHTITGLATGTQYYVRVRPYNDYEMGGSTYWQHYDSVTVTTGGTAVPTPTPTSVPSSTLPSQNPPAGLAANKVPQFVLLGSDDNHQANGMAFFRQLLSGRKNPAGTGNAATFDGLPMSMSFYIIGTNIYGPNINSVGHRDEYMALYNAGHEIGNHAFDNNPQSTYAGWMKSLGDTDAAIERMLQEYGISQAEINARARVRSGIRAPQDGFNAGFFQATRDLGYNYTNSTVTGHDSNLPPWWPGTLDNGWLGFATWDNRQTGSWPGWWEIPQDYLVTNATTGATGGYCDKDYFEAPLNMTGAQYLEYLKNTFLRQYNGNRSPFSICVHSQDWGSDSNNNNSLLVERRQAMTDFVNWLQTYSDARVVSHAQLLDWMKNPVALSGVPVPTPTPIPTPSPSSKFSLGDQVETTAGVNVRASASASGALLGTQLPGGQGVVTGGPVAADGFNWWQVNYTVNPDGWSVENWLQKAIAPVPTPTPAASVTLSVDASRSIYPFKSTIRGVATSIESWFWHGLWQREGTCCPAGKRDAIIQATKLLKPGIIRYAGGLAVNNTGWWRNYTSMDDPSWTYTDPQTGQVYNYRHSYIPPQVDSVADFAKQVGAEVMVQVNVCDNNPKMWADMVKYTNIEKNYKFKYWEIGNELDLDTCVTAQQYADRFAVYQTALKAIDPTIKVMGPVPTMPDATTWFDTLRAKMGSALDVLVWHWYQLTEWTANTGTFAYQGGSVEALLNYNESVGSCQDGFGCPGQSIDKSRVDRTRYRRSIAETMKQTIIDPYRVTDPTLEIAITEFGVHSSEHTNPINGNHLAAIWLADVLARHAYNGVDIITYFTLEDGGSGLGNSRGLTGIYEDNIDVRPIYSTMYLYAQYFGDTMVQSATSDATQKVVVWASTDSKDPGKLKLMLVNLTDKATSSAISISNFSAMNGSAYEMTSEIPTSLADPDSFTGNHTFINGVRIPDVQRLNPNAFAAALAGISPRPVTAIARSGVNSTVSYTLPAYSAVAMILNTTGAPAPTPPLAPPAQPDDLPTITSVDTPHLFSDKSSGETLRIRGTNFVLNTSFSLHILQGGVVKATITLQPKDTTTIEASITPSTIGSLVPGSYTLELIRVSDNASISMPQQSAILITKLGDVWGSSGTRDGKIDIYDVSRFLSKWKSILSSDIFEFDINPGPNNVSLNKIDIYDINKMMSNWSR